MGVERQIPEDLTQEYSEVVAGLVEYEALDATTKRTQFWQMTAAVLLSRKLSIERIANLATENEWLRQLTALLPPEKVGTRSRDKWEELLSDCREQELALCEKDAEIRTLHQRIADLAEEVETLKGLLREYRKTNEKHHLCDMRVAGLVYLTQIDDRCDLCKRTDQQLQPTQGEQG